MGKITYRIAQKNKMDVDILFNLSVELEKYSSQNSTRPHEHFTENWQEYFKEEIEDSLSVNKSWVFIAEDNETAIGYIYSRICEDCYIYVIEELLVKDEYRGQGVGKELLNKAVEVGKQYEYPIRVEVFDWNSKAIDFYKKQGFHADSVILQL